MKKRKQNNILDSIKDFFINLKEEFLMLSTGQKVAVSTVAGLLFVVIVGSIILIAVFSDSGELVDDPSSGSTSDSTSTSGIDDSYDPTEFDIDEQGSASILAETEDAGEDYLLNSMFLGDSNTVGFAEFGLLPLENVVGVESMGIQSVASQNVVYYEGSDTAYDIPYAVAAQQPQRIYMTYGTNNLIGVSPDQFVANYVNAVNAILAEWEYCDVIIVTVPPIGETTSNPNLSQKTVDQFNLALVDMVEENGWKLLNTTTLLKGDNGYIKSQYVNADGIHLTSDAHKAILDFASTHALETDDRRPQPLAAQPERKDPPADASSTSTSSSSESSSTNPGAASQGEIEKLKLAVANGKKKLLEAVASSTGDGSDLTGADVGKDWVPEAIYTTLSTAVATGEELLAQTEPTATSVISSEAAINSAITNFDANIKTGVDKTPVQIAREELVAEITAAKTTLVSAVSSDDPATVPKDKQSVPVAIYNALDNAIKNAESVNNTASSTETNLQDAKGILNAAKITFTGAMVPGTGLTQDEQNLINAKAELTATINEATAAKNGITIAESAPTTPGTRWVTSAVSSALDTAITNANTAHTTATTADDVNKAQLSLKTAIATYNSAIATVAEPSEGG